MSCIPAKAGDGIHKIHKKETADFFIISADVMVKIAYLSTMRTMGLFGMQLTLNNLKKVRYISLTHPTRLAISFM